MNILLNWLRPYVLINDILKIIAYPVDKSKHIDKQKFKNKKRGCCKLPLKSMGGPV